MWLPGLQAPPGPCYWLVPSGSLMGWRRGRLAAGLVRSTVCYYCLGWCSALVVCVRRFRQVWGVGTGAGSLFSLWASPFPRVPRGACGGLSRPDVPSLCPLVRWFHVVCAFRGLGPVALWVHAACPLGVGALVLRRRTRPPPLLGVARALRAVLVQGARRAIPEGSWLPPSRLGDLGARGVGGRCASVRPPASVIGAPMRASLASLFAWRVWSPY